MGAKHRLEWAFWGWRMKTIGLFSALLFGCWSAGADTVRCDVLVVGGGTAGVVAAIQTGRLGAKTVLVEVGSMLGGQATVGGVNSPILFTLQGKQRVKGIGWEWIAKTVELDDGKKPESYPNWRINAPLFAITAEELLQQAGVEIRYFEAPSAVEPVLFSKEKPYNWLVTTAAMGERRVICCKQIVDCTGSGAVCALAGAERLREKKIMPGNLNYQIKTDFKVRPDQALVEKKIAEAMKNGSLLESDVPRDAMLVLDYQAATYILDADTSTAQKRTDANLRGRQAVLRVLRFLRSLPGGETSRLVSMSAEVGVRESYRVRGEYVITVDDYLSGRVWDDSIAYATFQVDMHKERWEDFDRRPIPPGVVPTVPLRALIPRGKTNLLVAGRCLSCDRLAFSGLRVQAVCMATGQAAGAAAALGAKKDVSPGAVDVKELKTVLKANGALVPGEENR